MNWGGTALALAAGMTWASCGGDSSTPSSPTTPTPAPTTNACSVISGGSGGLAILNGTECPTSGTSVVLLNIRDSTGQEGVGQCTGTVIGARAVLTAAHCLDGDAGLVRIFRGSGETLTASSFQKHPRYSGSGGPAYDVGVVLTSEDLGRVAIPLLLSREPGAGETVVLGGWGLDQNGNGTTLRAGLNTVSAVSALYFETQYSASTTSVCYGDSGGSALVSVAGSWAVAGVTSQTSASGYNCSKSTSYFAAVRPADIRSFILGLVPDAVPR